jgi:putative ABC transport system permease protein
MTGWSASLTVEAEPTMVAGAQVTPSYFDVLGVAAHVGRTFTSDEGVPNAPRAVILSYGFWRRAFGADPTLVGRLLSIGDEPHTVVGVMPETFEAPLVPSVDMWRPLRLDPANASRGLVVLRGVARLRSGLSLDDARVRAGVLARRLEAQYPESNDRVDLNLVALHEQTAGDVRLPLLVLLASVGAVLLIACANIANLFMARAHARGREIAVRFALGASRGQVARLLFVEGLVLSALGAGLGLAGGGAVLEALAAAMPPGGPRLGVLTLDARVLAFTAAVTLVTAFFFSLLPALRLTSDVRFTALRQASFGELGRGALLRRGLVVAEVAVALVLLVGAGLLLRSLSELQRVDLGFETREVLTAGVVLPPARYGDREQLLAFQERLLERLRVLPGASSAAITSLRPFSFDSDVSFEIEGRAPPTTNADTPVAWFRTVTGEFFRTLDIPVRGRPFEPIEAASVVIVGEALARRYWPDQQAIGRRIRFQPEGPWLTIVGVVPDLKTNGPAVPPRAQLFVPARHLGARGLTLLVRAEASRLPALVPALRDAVRAEDPSLPLSFVATMDQLAADAMVAPRFVSALVGLFALLALALASFGVYGVMAYVVSHRTREIGVRLALGAKPRDVFREVVGDGLRLAGLGAALGLGGAVLLSRSLSALLFEVSPRDPFVLTGAAVVLVTVAATACAAPARRAARVDPMAALRIE